MKSRKQDKNLNQYRLYHAFPYARNALLFMKASEAAEIFRQEAGDEVWELVGLINAIDLDHAYQMTNSIETLWTKNIPADMLMVNFRAGCRSTSIGDVFVDCETGQVWHVSRVGFTEMEV